VPAQQPLPDDRQHRICLNQHLPVVKPQNGKANSAQRFRPSLVSKLRLWLKVLATVQFHYQAGFEAGKVGKELSDRVLPPELATLHAAVAQVMPQQALGVGGCAAQGACPPLQGAFRLAGRNRLVGSPHTARSPH
jgi:hypothetical protein